MGTRKRAGQTGRATNGWRDLAVGAVLLPLLVTMLAVVPVRVAAQVPPAVKFAPAANYGAGSSPYSVAIGDLNGDSRPDLVVANKSYNSDNVSVLLGSGTGTFGPAANYAVGDYPLSVAIGDLNGDGKFDLAVANYGYDSTVSVLLGSGNGTFSTAANYAVEDYSSSVVIGDLNGDGKLDLAVAKYSYDGTVSVLPGSGTGTFGPATGYGAGNYPQSVAIGDLNGDGRPDLVTANNSYNSGTVSVLIAAGAPGGFSPATGYVVGDHPQSVAIGDLNGDGWLDLAVANVASDNASVLLNLRNTAPALTVNPPMLPAGTTGVPYSQSLTATRGTAPSTFTITRGYLPPGLTLATNGTLSGTPTQVGTFAFTVMATDSGGNAGSRAYTVVVNVPVVVNPASLVPGTAGLPYRFDLTAMGGTGTGFTFAVTAGSLPPGLALEPTGLLSGTLSGTPTQVGTFTFTVTATDSGMNSGSKQYTLTITPAPVMEIALMRASGGTVTGGVANVGAGGTMQLALTATHLGDMTQPVTSRATYTSSDPAKATVDSTGKVSALSPGTVTITANYMGRTATFMLVVTAPGTGGLMPNPAPAVRPAGAMADPATVVPLPAPPRRTEPTPPPALPVGAVVPSGGEPLPPTPMPLPAPPRR